MRRGELFKQESWYCRTASGQPHPYKSTGVFRNFPRSFHFLEFLAAEAPSRNEAVQAILTSNRAVKAELRETMFSNALGSLVGVGSLSNEESRLVRVQGLMAEVREMEETLGVSDFAIYFDAIRELKDLLIQEVEAANIIVKKQNLELERLTIMVEEKNKAVSTLADANEEERSELKKLRARVKELEAGQVQQEEREVKLKRLIAKFRGSSVSSISNPPIEELTPKGVLHPSPFETSS
ncbi:hypothetical protein BSKO_10846 [Bryopsis sp. KO-2023]|nr:hypothetical protein BSKO_10846 [Bryopsis sp. KO-2023]